MFFKNKKFLLYLIFIFFLKINYSLANNNIYYIDVDKLLTNTNYGLQVTKKLENLNNNILDKISAKEKMIQDKDLKIKQSQNLISNEEMQKNIKDLRSLINDLVNDKKKYEIDFNNSKENLLNDFFNQIKPIIEEYVKDNSIDILLDKKTIFMGNINNDITTNIVNNINKKFK